MVIVIVALNGFVFDTAV